ncbi:MAG: NAD(P) transhydrogenase subunit alpha [Pirellulales bacterium]|jgi:NAD(P) transhydrogenase subunit alpha|nr:NAD(P) transhydrogenase subunit alpha [Thermoguttaceae bacterium]MDD4789448.1 NAD(P) transhydrogenase subunit alpha [Pirellulales bacterium]
MTQRSVALLLGTALLWAAVAAWPAAVGAAPPPSSSAPAGAAETEASSAAGHGPETASDSWSMVFVLLLATFIGMGVIARVSRLLHTPLMSITNAISAIAVVGAIIVTGPDFPLHIRIIGAIALFASMTNIVSGFLITDRMLKMFKQTRGEAKP